MKNSIKTIGAMAMILFATVACKKEEKKEVNPRDQKFSVVIETNSTKGEPEKGIMIGTQAELEAALSGKDGIFLKKASQKFNVFVPVTGTPLDPKTPVDMCWDEINAYYNAHIEEWLHTANQTCKSVVRCITCPNAGVGLFVLYDIKPTSIKCNTDVAVSVMYNFQKFNIGDKELESEALAKYMRER